MEDDLKKMNGRRRKQIKWKTNQSTKSNLIGCDTIVNSPVSFSIRQKSWKNYWAQNWAQKSLKWVTIVSGPETDIMGQFLGTFVKRLLMVLSGTYNGNVIALLGTC